MNSKKCYRFNETNSNTKRNLSPVKLVFICQLILRECVWFCALYSNVIFSRGCKKRHSVLSGYEVTNLQHSDAPGSSDVTSSAKPSLVFVRENLVSPQINFLSDKRTL